MTTLLVGIATWVLNLAFLAVTAATFPGNWLMVGLAVTVKFCWPAIYSWPTLVAALCLAALGEWLEFITSAKHVKKSGGTRAGAWGAILGSMVGMVVGQMLIPVPIVGLLIGAAGGAFAGTMLFEKLGGKSLGDASRSGRAAAKGRLLGTAYKFICGLLICILLGVAVFL